ncbi:MAG: hypothetical protein WCI46_07020 [Verrucomicrobiota bacterium]
MNFSSTFSLLPLISLLAACSTPHPFPTPNPSWKSHLGQLKYHDASRSLIGDVLVQKNSPTDFYLDFQKTGGISLISLHEDATTARVEGLLAHYSWQGSPSNPPKHLLPWIALREAFLTPPLTGSYTKSFTTPPPTSWKISASVSNGHLQTLSCQIQNSPAQFDFHFHP